MKQIRKHLTLANVLSTVAVFLVLGGATAVAATQLGKNTVGTKQLKSNAVTAAKIKKNAVTAAKIKANAITTAKVKNGAITGAKVNLGSLGTVPNSATTETVKGSHGVLALGQEATVLEHGPLKLTVKCEVPEAAPTYLSPVAYISSSAAGSAFTSWDYGSKELGPTTPESERKLNEYYWAGSTGSFGYDAPTDIGVSASAANGAAFNAFLGLAAEKDSGTCWWWANATILG
ncbi:MAG TPA: hypothetical protein VFB52_13685 [Solirubrobacterales bacterium]|nr:hypothetical protein [Solirubrobacterales bacterium]